MTDLTITDASVLWTGKKDTGRAGGTITPGMPVYKDTTDNNDLKAADASASASAEFAGFALNSAADGQPLEYGYGEGTLTVGGTGVSVGATYVVSATAGGIAPEGDIGSGEFMTYLGVGASTSTIKCAPHSTGVAHA